MAASDSNNLSNLQKLTATLIISGVLTACGGGGGGGGSDSPADPADDDRGVDTEVELPAFLKNQKENCFFTESDAEVRLEYFQGSLKDVNALRCNTRAELENLAEIELLSGLTSLELPYSNIQDLNPLLVFSSQLKTLNLRSSSLDDEDLAVIGQFANLETLDLRYNGLNDEDLTLIGQLTNLETLNLSGNGFNFIDSLVNLLGLRYLDLSDNEIKDLTPLYALTGLEQLFLTGRNNGLACADVFDLALVLETAETGNIVVPPSRCANVISLGDSSPDITTIDNSLEEPAYDRLVVRGEYTLDNLRLSKSENDLSVVLSAGEVTKTITFSNWFVGNVYQIAMFELPDGSEYSSSFVCARVPMYESLSDEDDIYEAEDCRNIVDAGSGDDNLLGGFSADTFFGGIGDDVLIGGGGADILVGGRGDDILIGGLGSVSEDGTITVQLDGSGSRAKLDTYVFNLGDAKDIIVDRGFRSDYGTLRFGEGITADMISLRHQGDHLEFVVNENDSVTIYNWYKNSAYQIDFVQFNDSEPLDAGDFVATIPLIGTDGDDDIRATSRDESIYGGIGEDNIYGAGGDDALFGGDNNDILEGGGGQDTLNGGSGNDILFGGGGSFDEDGRLDSNGSTYLDIYIFNLGDDEDLIVDYRSGADYHGTLRFGEGITPDSIRLQRVGDDLKFIVSDSDIVTVYNWYKSGDYRIKFIQFGNAEVIDAISFVANRFAVGTEQDDVFDGSNKDDAIDGASGDDFIRGISGNDQLAGGLGDDILMGGSGSDTLGGGPGRDILFGASGTIAEDRTIDDINGSVQLDTYLFNLNDGHDLLVDYHGYISGGVNNHGTLRFGEGITESMITLNRKGDNLEFAINENDSMTVYNWYRSSNYKIKFIQFGDLEPLDAESFVSSRLP